MQFKTYFLTIRLLWGSVMHTSTKLCLKKFLTRTLYTEYMVTSFFIWPRSIVDKL